MERILNHNSSGPDTRKQSQGWDRNYTSPEKSINTTRKTQYDEGEEEAEEVVEGTDTNRKAPKVAERQSSREEENPRTEEGYETTIRKRAKINLTSQISIHQLVTQRTHSGGRQTPPHQKLGRDTNRPNEQRNKWEQEHRMHHNSLASSTLHWKRLADQDAEDYLEKILSHNSRCPDAPKQIQGWDGNHKSPERSVNTTRRTQYDEEEKKEEKGVEGTDTGRNTPKDIEKQKPREEGNSQPLKQQSGNG